MNFFSELLHRLRDLPALVQWAGYVGLFAIVFTETGLFFGFFLPGDSLLVTAGLLASQGLPLDVRTLGFLLSGAAILGDNTNYWIGRISGERIFTREESLLFKPKHLQRAADFYAKHGAKTVVLARFMPIVRTFAPLVAGAARMPYRTFLTFSVIGGLAWIWSMLAIGYFLGSRFPGVSEHLELVIIVVVLLSISPGIVSWLRTRRAAATAGAGAGDVGSGGRPR
ncbi:SNARE associated protein [Gemmatirosa kalamazoonensis]|uniref:SNARE associated protein n=1 Tax=Gemmatirosa kalamazoonensis TaxID=861299 RepID=W0RKA7_9BACT|nr:VTT domain-containing protein [Gemmatirosa kalamazoonensis]AHG91181.1 SNARE associated protein [Gemmatirosa kalamazoonensis]